MTGDLKQTVELEPCGRVVETVLDNIAQAWCPSISGNITT
jgi:hypothetical protein